MLRNQSGRPVFSVGAGLLALLFLARPGLNPATRGAEPESAKATTNIPSGHSHHGETFNEGPRQRAYLMEGVGKVRFPVTTSHPEAQQFIHQGVGQLHGFWYYEAERSFRQAAMLDPKCAMAYWGMALANTNNEKRARGFIAQAVERKTGITDRETLYIDALEAFLKPEPPKPEDKNKPDEKQEAKEKAREPREKERHEAYAKALEQILYKFPDDIEAKALLGLQLWLNRSHGSPITSYLAVDALLKEVLAVEPLHPCHHYRIHLWDYEKAELALDSAARGGAAAPAIAHMWHMPGHIYSRLERYADAAWQQEASARVDHAYMMRDRIFPDQIHNYAHNNEWLIRDLVHVGRIRDAVDMAKNLCELPRHPKHNTLENGKSSHFGRLRLFEDLTRFELWDELIALADSTFLPRTEISAEQVKRLRYLGAACFRKGDMARGKACIADIEHRWVKEAGLPDGAGLRPAAVSLPTGVDGKSPAPSDDAKKRDARLRPLDLALDELYGHWSVAAGDLAAGSALLKRAGGIDPLYLARLDWQANRQESALKEARSAAQSRKNQVQPLAGLIELLWQAGERKEVEERFAALRELAARADLEAPPLARLAPIAQALGLPSDWRIAKPAPADFGERPPLESLGPLRWSPPPAPEWTLVDSFGQEFALAQYRGRPIVLIFYLGHQCLHCAEQLQKFAPLTGEFQEAGISLLAISSDDRDGLQKSLANYKGGTFPFPLASDAPLEIFKAYRAYDDFEQKPLHGTFLIDGNGFVCWHDVSFEPFQDPKFLLEEARRLLSLSSAR